MSSDWADDKAKSIDSALLLYTPMGQDSIERRRIIATALRAAARVPECSVALPLCGGRLVIPNVCTVFATVDGEVREGDVEATWNGVSAVYSGLFYKTLPGGVIETTTLPLDQCHPTREAAEAATSAAARGVGQ